MYKIQYLQFTERTQTICVILRLDREAIFFFLEILRAAIFFFKILTQKNLLLYFNIALNLEFSRVKI
jgi:hypothetical protein